MTPRRAPQRLNRKVGRRKSKDRILVVCEGEVTEVEYFKGVKDYFRSLPVEVVDLKVVGRGCDPRRAVEFAVGERDRKSRDARAARDSFLAYDQTWCVVDVDDHTTLDSAVALALREGIKLVVSCPCFELWLLLHFQIYSVQTNRFEISRKLSSHIFGYDKGIPRDFPYDRYELACKRADIIDPGHCVPNRLGANPSTNVWLLVNEIQASGRTTIT